METQCDMLTSADQHWQEWAAGAHRRADRLARRLGLSDPEDLAQEALARCMAAIRRGLVIERPCAWIEGTLKRLALEARRRRIHTVSIARPVGADLAVAELPSHKHDPVKECSLREVPHLALRWLGSLPPPFRQIAALQHLAERPRREVSAWLRGWRPVGEDEVRRLMTQTHAMLRALGSRTELRLQWPSAFQPRKNRWLTTPPHTSYTMAMYDAGKDPQAGA